MELMEYLFIGACILLGARMVAKSLGKLMAKAYQEGIEDCRNELQNSSLYIDILMGSDETVREVTYQSVKGRSYCEIKELN